MHRLSERDILGRLQELSNWTLNNGALETNLEFNDFKEALKFINQLGSLAEEANHHPELHNVYNKVNVRLWTHDANGITNKDFDLAEKVNQL
jgi:4a-hydroxytetrahydrobiopterin dehydratase